MKRLNITLVIILTIVSLFSHMTNALEIKLPITSDYSVRDNFNIGLLKLLLKKIPGEHQIITATSRYSQSRIVMELQKEGSIDLYWMGTSAKLEQDLLPIYFPIYRGLMGHRVFIINKKDRTKFTQVKSLRALQKLQGVQGRGWSDIEILEHSNLPQYPAMYENIFNMINKRRVDYFSRGINEAFKEVSARKGLLENLVVDDNILLVYPFAFYFFTNVHNEKLAISLNRAFSQAYQDGSFLEYFYNHPEIIQTVNKLESQSRVRIDIPNPFLTPKTAHLPEKYWH